ncbi:MAG TPA: response regulator, partial [Gemmatimonadaceae bacterium]
MPLPVKSILWVDDEADLLESHRIFLRDKGYDVDSATNADDAVEMLRRRPYGLVLLDEQMPGKRGLEAFRELRDVDPALPIVMVTKSEEDTTMREAIGANINDYLVKPINPRQVLTVVTRILEGPQIRQQAVARQFVERFRALQNERDHALDWRGWIERYGELVDWDIELTQIGEMGLHESLEGLYPTMRRDFAAYIRREYPRWLRDLEGDRPPLSIDVVGEFLLPILERERAAMFVVV